MTTLRLGYQELAERLGLSTDAARMRAKRRGWRVEQDNERRAWVHVEEIELQDEAERSPHDGRTITARAANEATAVRSLEMAVAALGGELAAVRQERDGLAADRDRLAAELADARVQAAGAEGERKALRDALADLAGRLDRAEAALAEARRPWLQRVFEAWRGS